MLIQLQLSYLFTTVEWHKIHPEGAKVLDSDN